MSTVFGKIIRGELPATRVYEDESIIVIEDLYPLAPVHLLIIPKKEYVDLQSIPEADLSIMAHVVKIAQELAKKYNVADGYRFLTNNGAMAGQVIFHLHFHLIGGKKLGAIG